MVLLVFLGFAHVQQQEVCLDPHGQLFGFDGDRCEV